MAVKKAMQAEAEGNGDVPVTFKGLKLTVPTGNRMPTAAVKAYEKGHMVSFLEAMLGPEQWAKVEPKVPALADIKDLADAINDVLGASSGE
jgi:hypothetical protein